MKIFFWLIGLPLAVLVVLFALSNRQAMDVGLWPFEEGLSLPVYLAVLAPFVLGLVCGYLAAGLKGFRHRRAARAHARRADALEREVEKLRAASPAGDKPASGLAGDKPASGPADNRSASDNEPPSAPPSGGGISVIP